METHNGGIFHASDTLLHRLDSAQHHFLIEIDMHTATAFTDHNFAPPTLRRNIGILGLLHKRVLGKCHPIFQKLLPFHSDVFGWIRAEEHNKQLYNHILEVHYQQALHRRSVFGMVTQYNKLPQNVVDCDSVSKFQHYLTLMARKRCQDGDADWMHTFSCRS